MFTKLKVYRGDKHPHEAQKPEVKVFAVGQGFKLRPQEYGQAKLRKVTGTWVSGKLKTEC